MKTPKEKADELDAAFKNNKKVAIVFEGRDAAGKGSTIKRFIEYNTKSSSKSPKMEYGKKNFR